ncbi:hypothetical protein BDR04DRAFT_1105572, partial [Suillus decipiens]
MPLCKQALAQIAVRLKACHSQFLGLQGNGKCTTCAKIETEKRERVLKELEQMDIEKVIVNHPSFVICCFCLVPSKLSRT